MNTDTPVAIAPLTPVYFGDGRPNDAGETDFGAGRFPPSPRTLQGLVRTTLLRSVRGLELGRGADPKAIAGLVGPPEHLPEGWQIRGPWPARWSEKPAGTARHLEPWLPAPGWLARQRNGKLHRLKLIAAGDLRADTSASRLMIGEGDFPRAWLSPADVWLVLNGQEPREPALDLPPFVGREPHTGLQLDADKRAARESMLYTLDFYRFAESSGLALRLSASLPSGIQRRSLSTGSASLGAKNRAARLLQVEEWSDDFARAVAGKHLPTAPAEKARFLVWATTPVFARNPLDPGLSQLSHAGAHLEILSAAIGSPQSIGGFSMAAGHSGVSRRYLSPGSAWLVELRGGNASSRHALLRDLHDSCLLGDDPAERTFGFGHALVALTPNSWSDA